MRKITYLTFLIIITLNSCVEKGEFVSFELLNQSSNQISIIEHSIYNSKIDTSILQKNEKLINSISESSGDVGHVPFHQVDTLTIIIGEKIITYTHDFSGKNPLKLEYYTLIETSSDKWGVQSKYEYDVLDQDFKIK
ncbi:MAG: hypothetical protein GQ527_09050 [Bacteroidales bacterium]|nr:hypothetical protein [Bacteroidales bacterium]